VVVPDPPAAQARALIEARARAAASSLSTGTGTGGGPAPVEALLAFSITFAEDVKGQGGGPVTVRYIAATVFERRQILAKLAYILGQNNDADKMRRVPVDPGLKAEAALQAAIHGADRAAMAPQYT